MKIQTIHHHALAFFISEGHCTNADWERPWSEQIIYEGKIDDIPYELAKSVAEVHPNFGKYNEMAMATLFKTYTFRGGTESPKLAIRTRMSKAQREQEECEFVVIWKIFEE